MAEAAFPDSVKRYNIGSLFKNEWIVAEFAHSKGHNTVIPQTNKYVQNFQKK